MRRALCLLLFLTQCATGQHRLFTGALKPIAGTCDITPGATLTVNGETVQFTPSSGVIILSGRLAPDGHIQAERVQPGADKKPYRLALHATLDGARIDGEYVTQRCRYAVHLIASD